MPGKNAYRLGALYPTKPDGTPNLILSSGYKLQQDGDGFSVLKTKKQGSGSLQADLEITTNPVQVAGLSDFVNTWLKPQLLNKNDENSIFYQYWQSIISPVPAGAWGAYPNNLLLEALSYLGYRGYGWDQAASQSGEWAKQSQPSGDLYAAVTNLDNYYPELLWQNTQDLDTIRSDFDTAALLQNLAKIQQAITGEAPLWYPAMLYTYGILGEGTSYPGPVLMIQPGEKLKLNFQNNIQIPELTEEQNQLASLIENSSYGLNGGATAGGMASTNFHMHGGHVTPSGFSDNVVARYTSGQDWTTLINIPSDHGQGSYWYHPHYHPAVNTQLYGGLSGFMQVGDPLSKIPAFRDVPRNLAVIKTMQVGIDSETGEYDLAAVNGNILGTTSLAPNRASMFTVNGEYMPTATLQEGGWQAITLSNQDNNYYMNIAIRYQQEDGSWIDLPLYIYGEDGHQYPQIRPAKQTVLGFDQPANSNATAYTKADNLISLPSGKRLDLLVYLPAGQSEIVSTYSFESSQGSDYQVNNLRFQADQYAELSSDNTNHDNPNSGPGPIARFSVGGDLAAPSVRRLDQQIRKANRGIDVQKISPDTSSSEYNNKAVPSVNLFEQNKRGNDIWKPIRERQFNYSILQLVGPEDQRDLPTQQAIAEYNQDPSTSSPYRTYSTLPSLNNDGWLGYDNPDLINDHVFPNGPLIIAQLGTIETWSLKNWNWGGPSVPNGGYFVGHPFHIHVNDYQVEASDTELANKRNLEDVTMLNASGYNYNDKNGILQKLDPLVGEFVPIPEAFDYQSDFYNAANGGLYTTGYNNTNIKMLFQDFVGTYVHHCHLLEHEDAGMMQVVTVIENTDSSWILPAQDLHIDQQGLLLRKADSLESITLNLNQNDRDTIVRAQVGDLTNDFIQDILLTSEGIRQRAGQVLIFDGATLDQKGRTKLLSRFSPYTQSSLAPWAFNSDFTGDGQRELVTAGYVKANPNQTIALSDLELTGWLPAKTQDNWQADYRYRPWQNSDAAMDLTLQASLTSFAVGDFNLDNFDDYAFAYLQDDQLRVRILDGASVSLLIQTGSFEGGYLPDTGILADMHYQDVDLADSESIALTTGFNSYSQSPIENLIVTAAGGSGSSTVLTFQLEAGHFIATGTMDGQDTPPSHEMHSSHGSHGAASSHGMDSLCDPDGGVCNLPGADLPMQLASKQTLAGDLAPATPTFAGVLGQGGLLVGNDLVIGQGATSDGFTIGNTSSSAKLNNTTQDLFISLDGIDKVNRDDLTGITSTTLNSSLSSGQAAQRVNLAMLTYQAYTNSMVKPSDLAELSAGNDGGSLTSQRLLADILTNYSAAVSDFYGGDLASLSSETIVRKAYRTLYNRSATNAEIRSWTQAVSDGLSKQELPLAILQDTSGSDRYHVALLAAASRWSQVQWGTSDVVDGSFGQGLQPKETVYGRLTQSLYAISNVDDWDSAQKSFNRFMNSAMNILDGSPVSDTGFF